MFEQVRKIVFITSESCNLNCKYCEISKNSTKNHFEEAKKVKQALLDGSYVTRYMQVANKYNIDVSQILTIDLWGQETTLTLNEFGTQFNRIMDWLFNCNHMFFSTNIVAFPERIVNFIKVVNNYFSNQEKRPFILQIQLSYDGRESTLEKRGVDPQKIINNIKKIISDLNEIEIDKKVLIRFCFHGVMTLDIMRKSLETNVDDYWYDMDLMVKEFYELNKNPRVDIGPTVFDHFQTPQYATKEDGQLVAKYAKACLSSTKAFQHSFLGILSPFAHAARSVLIEQSTDPALISYKTDAELNNFSTTHKMKFRLEDLSDTFNYEFDKVVYSEDDYLINDRFGCGAGSWQLKMRYDGTDLYCQNTFYNLNKEDFEDKIGAQYDLARFDADHPGFQPNLLTASAKDVQNFIDIFDTKKHHGHLCLLSNIINLMYILAQNGQIDESYKTDKEKLLRHSIYVSQFSQCFYNNIIDSGSIYGASVSTMRFFCNGMLDIVEDYAKQWGYFGPWS